MPWKWIHHNGGYLYDVGILPDGTLHNPRGYDEGTVYEAIRGAEERRHARRSERAKQAAITRKRRQEKRVYEVARGIVARRTFGPGKHCHVCGKPLTDTESITRGIGSECWQRILEAISEWNRAGVTAECKPAAN